MTAPSFASMERSLGRRLWHGFWRMLCRVFAIIYLDYRIRRVGRVPRRGGIIFAANHQSYFDPVLVGVGFQRQFCYLARDSLFRNRLLGWFLGSVDALPVARESVAPRQGMEVAIAALRAGMPVVLFPEGTRSEDGSMGPLRRGIVLIARQSGCPVVPVYIDGAFECWPRRRRWPQPGHVQVLVGEPIRYGADAGAREREKGSGVSSGNVQNGPLPAPPSRRRDSLREAAADADSEGTGRGGRAMSSEFLEALGEAFRALESEARRLRPVRGEGRFRGAPLDFEFRGEGSGS